MEKRKPFRFLIEIFFRFDSTFASLLAQLALRIATNKEELEEFLQYFESKLPKNVFQRILMLLADGICSSDHGSFIQQLGLNEKVHFVQWFTVEKCRPLFVFDLLTQTHCPQAKDHREACRDLLRQMRLSDDCILRERAMTYTVPWNDPSTNEGEEMDQSESESSASEMS